MTVVRISASIDRPCRNQDGYYERVNASYEFFVGAMQLSVPYLFTQKHMQVPDGSQL